jgi:hypothetical protein
MGGVAVTVDVLLGAGLAAGLGAALVMLAAGLVGTVPDRQRPPTTAARIRAAAGSPTLTARVAAAAGAGLLVGLLTRWPVAAAGAGALVLAWPSLIGGAATERLAIDRLEALALWTESLKDMIAGAVGLEQAIPVSVDAAHPLLRPRLVRLAGRLRGREPLEEALRQFAADLDDASADLIIAALILNSRLRGPGLRATLERLAASARQELDMRRKVEAGRRGIRLGVQMIVALTVGFAVLLAVFSRQYVAPYGSVVGQVILAGVLAVFAAGFAWLRRLSAEDLPDTFLARPGQLDDRVPGGGAEVSR